MMKLNDKTKRWLIIAACGLFCAALVSLIGARFIPQAPIDKPTSSGEDTQEVSPTAEVPEKQEEKEVVIIPEPRPEPVSEAAAISTGTGQTIQPDPVIPSESEKPVAQGDHTDPNQQPIYKPEDTSKPSPQSAPQNGDTSGGIPSVDDKLVQEVMRMILESIYEPNFSNLSHGFRPKRSCHTALMHVQRHFTGVKWFIEGDIKGFFDNINHQTMVSILRKRIKDEYFLGLI